MAECGIRAEVVKLAEKVAKEIVRKHPMIANAATWHKQMQETCRTQQQQIELLAQRVRKLDRDNFEFARRIEALTRGKAYQPPESKPEAEVPVVPVMTAAQMRRIRARHQFSQDNFAKLLGVSTVRYGKWEKGKQPIPPDIVKQLEGIRAMKASDLRSRMINCGVFQTNGMTARQQKKEPDKSAQIFLQSPLTDEDLKQIRTRLNMTQKRMAELLGAPVPTYQTWERARSHMPDRHTARMREISKMEPDSPTSRTIRGNPSPFHAQQLKDIRLALDLTQGAIAEKIGVKARTFQAWEQGKAHMPDIYTAAAQSLSDTVPKDAAGKPIPRTDDGSKKECALPFHSDPSPVSAEELNTIRSNLQLSQHRFAKKIGVNTTTYQAWERGRAHMPDRYTGTVRKLSQAQPDARHVPPSGPSAFSPQDLKRIREALRFSQRKVADKIGVKPTTYQSWEQGKARMPERHTATVRALAQSILPSMDNRRSSSSGPAAAEAPARSHGGRPAPSPITARELKTIRASARLTQKQMARTVGVPISTYTSWEIGKARMPDRHTTIVRELDRNGASQTDPSSNRKADALVELTPEILVEIKQCRERCALNIDEMALLLEIRPDICSDWESGRTNAIPKNYLERIRHLMRLPEEERVRFIARRTKKVGK